jgi:flagellar biosynthetic protein FlhB
MPEDTGQERTEEATPRRREEARRKGTVARSTDLTSALVLLSIGLVSPSAGRIIGCGVVAAMGEGLVGVQRGLDLGNLIGYTASVFQPALTGLAVLIGTALVVGLGANFAQVGFAFSIEALTPSLSKIDPIQGFRRLLSWRSTFEATKTIAKALLFGWIAYAAVASEWDRLLGLGNVPPSAAAAEAGLVIAALDYLFQRAQTNKQLRMTKDELKREMKEQEGSPEVRAAQAQRRRKLVKGRLRDRVKSADVVVTNPTHYAVALQYDRSRMHAPMVVAKGQDYLALNIRKLAREYRVPSVPNPPLARALYRECEVGDFVPRDLFQAVAEVLAYVYRTVKGVRG